MTAPPGAQPFGRDRGLGPGAEASSSANTAPVDKNQKPDPKAKGFVYRAWLNVADVDGLTPKVTDTIRELGGEKAGEVELGWRKGSGSYYHFSLPEKNEQEVMDRLRAFGRVRFSKDPHPRVMPAGQIRFILWVEADRSR
jgi:hypothetical protein